MTVRDTCGSGFGLGRKFFIKIDRIEERVYIYRADGSREELDSFKTTLSGEDVLKGFKLRLADLDWV
ncbi:MAG: hypothetical protein JNL70_15815 [Saprospiraceae bacterium]|nr:hypothetical protein [Saprospiraceae bacterium]